MKNLSSSVLFALVLALSALGLSSVSNAAEAPPVGEFLLPNEVSAMLVSPLFHEAISREQTRAQAHGKELRISRFGVMKLGANGYAYAYLATRVLNDPAAAWITAGSIATAVNYGPTGEAQVTSAYFKPDQAGPGGASVGN